MLFKLSFHPEIENDISDAWTWYEGQLAGLGDRFLKQLEIAYKKLETTPENYGILFNGSRRIKLRHFPYIVIFEIFEVEVFIYAVYYMGKNPDSIKGRVKYNP